MLPDRDLKAPGLGQFELAVQGAHLATGVASPIASALGRFGMLRSIVGDTISGAVLARTKSPLRVIRSLGIGAPKLVALTHDAASRINEQKLGYSAFPLIESYRPAELYPAVLRAPRGVNPDTPLSLHIRAAGQPIKGIDVTAITSLSASEGARATTDETGVAILALGPGPIAVEVLTISAPRSSFWGACRKGIQISDGETIDLPPIAIGHIDCLRQTYTPFDIDAGKGVMVGVIDSGIGPHSDLSVAAGSNEVLRERSWTDNGLGHGTHVAGIIAARPESRWPMGVAPAAKLWSGRVFGANSDSTSNLNILSAMKAAIIAGCDIINVSIESSEGDNVLEYAVADACDHGAIVVCAAGNDATANVASPARCLGATGVSAFGRFGACPGGSFEDSVVGVQSAGPHFFASFSNWGQDIDFIGPGVGVISASLSGGYEVRSGTSMSCAAVSGMAARLLSANETLLSAPRDAARSVGIQNLLQDHARKLGFRLWEEGSGSF